MYVRARVRIQCKVESGVTQSYNIEDGQTHESVMHGSTMPLHNRRTLNSLKHALSSSMPLNNTRPLKAFGHASELSIQFYVQVLEIR